jgi:hypothetical protein
MRGLEARARNGHNNESARLDIHSANAKDAEEFRLITIHTLLPTKKICRGAHSSNLRYMLVDSIKSRRRRKRNRKHLHRKDKAVESGLS